MYNYFLTQALIKEAAALELLKEAQLLKLAARKRSVSPAEKLRAVGRGALYGGLAGLPIFAYGVMTDIPELMLVPLGTAALGALVARAQQDYEKGLFPWR
jgi:hypothetical protein